MKILQPILFWGACLFIMLFQACRSDLNLPNYEKSTPTNIYALRRVELKENLVFGKTAIRAVITSDINSKNISKTNLIVQDLVNEAAIVLSLNFENNKFKLGDVVILNLENTKMSYNDNELTISDVDIENISIESSNRIIPAKSTNLASLIANAKYWGPILIKLDKININSATSNKLNGQLLIDDEIVEIRSNFLNESIFANEENPAFVQGLKGLARIDKEGVLLSPRNLEDIQVGLLELLEDFEQSTNTDYNVKVMNFITGSWTIDGGITATSSSDPKNGKQSIRLQGTVENTLRNGIIAMNFDLKGVKAVSISYGIYPAAAEVGNVNPTVFQLEVSRDSGATYTVVGTGEIDNKSITLSKTEFQINATFSENIRLRIVNTSIPFANKNRPRINIDDIHFKF